MNCVEDDMKIIREPSVSGMFYPDDPSVLRKDIGNYLRLADVEPYSTAIRAVISPHAGYIYSGQVAAYAYKAISGLEFDTIIVIAPSHRAYFQGIAIWEEGNFRTPLGNIGIDEKNAQNLLNLKSVSSSIATFTRESILSRFNCRSCSIYTRILKLFPC
jgi:MEMO1 family protein